MPNLQMQKLRVKRQVIFGVCVELDSSPGLPDPEVVLTPYRSWHLYSRGLFISLQRSLGLGIL